MLEWYEWYPADEEEAARYAEYYQERKRERADEEQHLPSFESEGVGEDDIIF